MKPKSKSKNAKNPDWQVPVDLKSVKPEDYRADIDSGHGSAMPERNARAHRK